MNRLDRESSIFNKVVRTDDAPGGRCGFSSGRRSFYFHQGRLQYKIPPGIRGAMETTRHVTATVYVVNDGATALHEHKRHNIHIPPGGHVDRDELPHEAGLREVKEEMGVAASLMGTTADIQGSGVEALPRPRHTLLYDINVHDGVVGHQHVDLSYYATVPYREINPGGDEAGAEAWGWFTKSDLRADTIDPDVEQLGIEAIDMAGE